MVVWELKWAICSSKGLRVCPERGCAGGNNNGLADIIELENDWSALFFLDVINPCVVSGFPGMEFLGALQLMIKFNSLKLKADGVVLS